MRECGRSQCWQHSHCPSYQRHQDRWWHRSDWRLYTNRCWSVLLHFTVLEIWLTIHTSIGAANADEKRGIFQVPVGTAWLKSQTIKGGIVPLRQYQPVLKRLIESGRAKPSIIFDKELRIEEAAKAYKEFSDHDFIKSFITHKKETKMQIENDGNESGESPAKRKRGRGW